MTQANPILDPLFLRNFGGLGFGCIDIPDSERSRILLHPSEIKHFDKKNISIHVSLVKISLPRRRKIVVVVRTHIHKRKKQHHEGTILHLHK